MPARKLDQATPEATLSDDSTAGNTNPNPIQPNPKSMITKHVECPNCKVTFKATEAQLSHNAKGVIKCGECGQRFVGNDHLTHKPEAAKPETTEADKLPSANTLSWLKNATTESYHGAPIMLCATEKNFADPACFDAAILTPDKTKILYSHHNHSEYDWLKQLDNENHPDTKKFLKACDDYKLMAGANFNETPISDKFAGNSQAIHQQKQALKPAVNSTEIPREYPANSLEIPKSTNSPIIKAKNPKDMPHVDLSEIAKIDDSAEKLAMLEKTIDELSAKPESDGLLFSSTRAFKLLKMNYGPVQKLFSQKQAEGKISTKKPFHIVYKEPV